MQLEKQLERINGIISSLSYNNEVLTSLLDKLDYNSDEKNEVKGKEMAMSSGLLHDIDNGISLIEIKISYSESLINRLKSYVNYYEIEPQSCTAYNYNEGNSIATKSN